MVKALIELMLGRAGRYLLVLYNEYHILLNAIIFAYGVLLIGSHINLRRIAYQMDEVILGLTEEDDSFLDPKACYAALIDRWKMAQNQRKTFIPSRNDLWITLVSRKDLIEILGIRPEYVQVVLTKAEKIAPTDTIPKQIYHAWELYRHQLLIGVRARYMEPEYQLKMRERTRSSNN